jgi:hypothetical protein
VFAVVAATTVMIPFVVVCRFRAPLHWTGNNHRIHRSSSSSYFVFVVAVLFIFRAVDNEDASSATKVRLRETKTGTGKAIGKEGYSGQALVSVHRFVQHFR